MNWDRTFNNQNLYKYLIGMNSDRTFNNQNLYNYLIGMGNQNLNFLASAVQLTMLTIHNWLCLQFTDGSELEQWISICSESCLCSSLKLDLKSCFIALRGIMQRLEVCLGLCWIINQYLMHDILLVFTYLHNIYSCCIINQYLMISWWYLLKSDFHFRIGTHSKFDALYGVNIKKIKRYISFFPRFLAIFILLSYNNNKIHEIVFIADCIAWLS